MLVVIGLVVGGILVGRDLIRAAELRSVISDVEKFKSAVNAFKLKFNCIPGDCINATDYWGTDPGGCPATPANTVPKVATCNGSGDGAIYKPLPAYSEEQFRFWQQLANANLIPGIYTGAVTSGTTDSDDSIFTINIPSAKMSGTGWVVRYWVAADFVGRPIDRSYANKNYFTLVGDPGDSNPLSNGGRRAISPQDAFNIDTKLDDAVPYTGAVLAAEIMVINNTFNCLTTGVAIPTEYVATTTTRACQLVFAGGF